MNKYIAVFSFALAISFASVAQIPEIEVKSALYIMFRPSFSENSPEMYVYGAGLGADVWLNRQLALGASHYRNTFGGEVYYDSGLRDEIGDGGGNYYFNTALGEINFMMTEFHVKYTTPRYKLLSFYVAPSFYALQYYYEDLNFGVATSGIGATVGCNIRINQWFKINLLEISAIVPSKDIFGDTKDIMGDFGPKQLYQLTGGLVFQVNRSK